MARVKGQCRLKRGEGFVIVLGDPVFMSEQCVSIREGRTDLGRGECTRF